MAFYRGNQSKVIDSLGDDQLAVGDVRFKSIVITAAADGTIVVYDAPDAAGEGSANRLAEFPPNAPEGCYFFDAKAIDGLRIDVSGVASPTFTITWEDQ